jgi:hypothetical protein
VLDDDRDAVGVRVDEGVKIVVRYLGDRSVAELLVAAKTRG